MAVHNSEIGHFGVEKTLKRLSKIYEKEGLWTGARLDVRKFILQCPYCQKMNHLKTPIHTHPFTTASYSMMDVIAIDTIGPLPPDKYGNKFIINAIDCFSRFVELYPIPDTCAQPMV